MSKRKR